VVVHSRDRLVRNLDHLPALVQGLNRKGVRVVFVNLVLSVMGAFAAFERSLIRERQREEIALAKQHGAYKGWKKTLSPEPAAEMMIERPETTVPKVVLACERAAELVQRASGGVPKALLARDYGIARGPMHRPCL
jgi:DNA invertase Pin-like site-specific DNA recombinase